MRRHTILLFGAGALLLAASAPGDWLVTRDGTRVETSGPWTVKGRQVIFTQPDGVLAALRLADVDLEASEKATAAVLEASLQAAEPEPEAKPKPRKSILKLTDADLRRPDPDPDDEGEDEDDVEPEEDANPDEPVRLVDWESGDSDDLGGLEITGSVRNSGSGVAAAIRVTVTVLDDADNPYTSRAFLQQTNLAPGRSSTFRALLPGIFSLPEDPTFEIKSEGISIQGSLRPQGSGDDAGDEDDAGEQFDEPPP